MKNLHSFHIPVMGIGFTIDSPLRVSKYGIDSVISLVDDILLERLREKFAKDNNKSYEEIKEKEEDSRAKRITAYLNLINDLSKEKFEMFKEELTYDAKALKNYLNILPQDSPLKVDWFEKAKDLADLSALKSWLNENLTMGSIDVNIMTKVDKENQRGGELLPIEYNDAHAAVRGFALSDVHSSMVLSAGMSPRLYAYCEHFEDFYPNEEGYIPKKIVLKVSDYRSALVQGKFLAKKGLWVSEYRIESGLNCGGHAFATEGFLMGPILEEFKVNRSALESSVFEVLKKALEAKNRSVPESLVLKISAQGGVGTAEEHEFLRKNYKVDSVGWGSPFLLVPEATVVDDHTMNQLAKAEERDLYLSNISPLGVPFNNLRGNSKDIEKAARVAKGTPGSACPKRFLALHKGMAKDSICSASRQFQHLKLKELEGEIVSSEAYQQKVADLTEKSCICVGLGTSALLVNGLSTKKEGEGVSICPGPNMAYYDKIISLQKMVGHIYGSEDILAKKDRPNMFVKELYLYLDYLNKQIKLITEEPTKKQAKYLVGFADNLQKSLSYYKNLLIGNASMAEVTQDKVAYGLSFSEEILEGLILKINNLTTPKQEVLSTL